MERGQSFDAVASVYDAQRSGYPSALFSDVAGLARLPPGGRVLEIGCGTGQATSGWLALGLDVTGVDPGVSLVAVAHEKFAGVPLVRFEVASFEDWAAKGRKFDLVAAAQSWHWVRGEIGYAKAAEALTPEGFLAIFGHTPARSAELLDWLASVYATLAPGLSGPAPEAWYVPKGPILGLIEASGRFRRPEHRGYAWRRNYSAAGFAAYLGTRSDHLLLAEPRRARLLAAVQAAIPESVETDWVINLYVAARI